MPTYTCDQCGEDLDEAVKREREQELDVLRGLRRQQGAASDEWSVRVFCGQDHENVFSGKNDG
jgi:hypothetical protein